jgi:hypothetical protein
MIGALHVLSVTAHDSWAKEMRVQARERYEAGTAHYNLREFREALADFR